ESERAVHSIKQFTEQNAIDCDCRIDGCFYTASNQSQIGLLSNALTTLDKYNLNAWHQCSSQELKSTGSIQNLAAYYSIHGGSIQPAKL
ncbi:hypothetical protein WB403_50255, partial [Streptomyces brasiliscabiei]